jgi:hypothetical protein
MQKDCVQIISKDGTYYFGKDGKAYTKGYKIATYKGRKYAFYFLSTGKAYTKGWMNIGNKKYYFNTSGAALTGVQRINGKYFYFNAYGQVQTGAQKINNRIFYFCTSGGNGVYGSAYSGWLNLKGYCYYFNPKTYAMETNKVIDGYKVDSYGRSKTRYTILTMVNSCTNSGMSNEQKIQAVWNYVVNSSWGYIRTYEHTNPGWSWYSGWTDDFASQLVANKGGNCFRYAALLGYMIKEATGYQVIVYHGYTNGRSGNDMPHGWITVNINGTWYAFDPDLYKFSSRSASYYWQPYSQTCRTIHRKGEGTPLY